MDQRSKEFFEITDWNYRLKWLQVEEFVENKEYYYMNEFGTIMMNNLSIFATFIWKNLSKIEIFCWHRISDFWFSDNLKKIELAQKPDLIQKNECHLWIQRG